MLLLHWHIRFDRNVIESHCKLVKVIHSFRKQAPDQKQNATAYLYIDIANLQVDQREFLLQGLGQTWAVLPPTGHQARQAINLT